VFYFGGYIVARNNTPCHPQAWTEQLHLDTTLGNYTLFTIFEILTEKKFKEPIKGF